MHMIDADITGLSKLETIDYVKSRLRLGNDNNNNNNKVRLLISLICVRQKKYDNSK